MKIAQIVGQKDPLQKQSRPTRVDPADIELDAEYAKKRLDRLTFI
jgi:hypothetical protein